MQFISLRANIHTRGSCKRLRYLMVSLQVAGAAITLLSSCVAYLLEGATLNITFTGMISLLREQSEHLFRLRFQRRLCLATCDYEGCNH